MTIYELFVELFRLAFVERLPSSTVIAFEDGLDRRWYGLRSVHKGDDGEGNTVAVIKASTMVTVGTVDDDTYVKCCDCKKRFLKSEVDHDSAPFVCPVCWTKRGYDEEGNDVDVDSA